MRTRDNLQLSKPMHLRLLTALFAIAIAMTCTTAHAVQGWFRAGKVTRIHTGHNGGQILLFSTETQWGAGCGDDAHGYHVGNDSESARRIYSTLMLAYALNKNVSVFMTGSCISGRPAVDAIQINDTDYF